MIVDLKTAIAHIKASRPPPDEIAVPKQVLAKIRGELTDISFIKESPRPPDGHPDQFWWDERHHLMKRSEVHILGVRLTEAA